MKFVDQVIIKVASGKGGQGAVSFRREAMVPRGGPDGGDGGRGGSVVFLADSRLHSLLDLRFKKFYRAQDGEPGAGANSSGRDGQDLEIKVPPGTLIKDQETGEILCDMATVERFVLLEGGIGGKGNTFYKSSVHQAPTIAQKGLPRKERDIELELKLLADVGLVGLPNAGKSTFISRISQAKPKVADYPFTTLVPHLGVVRYNEEQSFVVADIPGLIEGAHQGTGLGHQFLRHVDRTRVFVHLVDATGSMGVTPLKAYKDIRRELELYDKNHEGDANFKPLSLREEIVVLTKIDAVSDEDLQNHIEDFKQVGLEVRTCSSVTGEGIKELVREMGQKVFAENG